MCDPEKKPLDLDEEHPFPRYQPQDEYLRYRLPLIPTDSEEDESIGWGE